MPPLPIPALKVWQISVSAVTPVGPWRYSLWTVALDRAEAEQAGMDYLTHLCAAGSSFRIARASGTPAYGWQDDSQRGQVYEVKGASGDRVPS